MDVGIGQTNKLKVYLKNLKQKANSFLKTT